MFIDKLERLVQEKRFLAAREVFRQLVEMDSLTPLALHLMAVVEAGLANLKQAVTYAIESERRARAEQDWAVVARVGSNLVELYRAVDDRSQAFERGQLWLAEQDCYPAERTLRGSVEYNLALICIDMHDLPSARSYLDAAARHMADDGDDPFYQVMARQMQARLAYEAEEFESGDRAWEYAQTLIRPDDLEGIREQLLLRAFRAFYALDYETAISLAAEFIVPTSLNSRLQQLGAVWILGMTSAKQGHTDDALAWVDQLQRLNMDGDIIVSLRYANGAIEILRRIKLIQEFR